MGQEEVVIWNLYYNDTVAAKATVDHILSYMRSIPSWAYNGGARAADSGNNGKWMPSMGTGKPDRGQMHYRSGLNMIPLLEYYRQHPTDDEWFLLEIAMGAITGQLTNSMSFDQIDQYKQHCTVTYQVLTGGFQTDGARMHVPCSR